VWFLPCTVGWSLHFWHKVWFVCRWTCGRNVGPQGPISHRRLDCVGIGQVLAKSYWKHPSCKNENLYCPCPSTFPLDIPSDMLWTVF
jgi:hypothetical protein